MTYKKGNIPWNKGKKIQTNTGRTHFKRGQKGWNKGLTKGNNKSLAKISEKLKIINKGKCSNTGRTHFKKGYPSWNKGIKCPQFAGSNHYDWKGGVSQFREEVRHLLENRQWRKDILKRDNYTCQICGEKKCWLIAHHIISFSKILQYYEITTLEEALNCEELWNINNGITLCEKCHKYIESKEFKSWAYFYIRGIMYNKTGILLPNENIIDGLFTMGAWGDNEESYALRKGYY